MAQLEIQLDKEEIHECDSKNRLTRLKEKFEKYFYRKPKEDFRECDGSVFQSYSGCSIPKFKDWVVCYLKGIEKGIDARVSHEEVLRIKDKDVNERRKKERYVIELEMLKLEKMTQKGACSNTGNAQRAKLSKKNGFHRAFSSLFGEDVEYFAPRLFFNMDKLEKQLNAEEFNEEIAMVVFKVLKNQLQQFITMQIFMDSDDQKTNHFFTEYTLYDAQKFQNILISLMDSIEKVIAKRGLYKKAHDNRVHERTMQTHEGMISKDASEIDNNVAGDSHDKDNITEALKQDEDKYVNNIIQLEAKNKDVENIVCKMGKSSQTLHMLTNEQSLYQENKRKMGLGYTDPCPLGQAIACHPKLYDVEILGLHYMKPNVHDTEEILNDAEESQVKLNEKQFHIDYERNLYDTFVPQTELSLKQEYFSNAAISSESESSKEMSDLPVLKIPNESRLLKMFDKLGDALSDLYTRINKTLLQDAERRWLSDSQ
ncbi:hypothetical protein Tco_0745521, partial [Tanacetum coccineum]